MVYTLKKVLYRLSRRARVLRRSPLKEWGAVLFKSNRQILLDAIVSRYDGSGEFEEEIDFLKKHRSVAVFPYRKVKQLDQVMAGYDATRDLPYVMHKERRLYFARSWSVEKASWKYRDFIENENILGGGYREKTPHQYQSGSFHVESDDLLLDVGCAEALFTLDVIDKVRKVILLESDPVWFDPLKATFEKEMEEGKVVLVGKNAGGKDTSRSITLTSVLRDEEYDSLFIKMDIEGSEVAVVRSCEELMETGKEIRFACCTYHKEDHAGVLEAIFERHRYRVEFSDGYMLFTLDKHLKFPYFRKGIIRASSPRGRYR